MPDQQPPQIEWSKLRAAAAANTPAAPVAPADEKSGPWGLIRWVSCGVLVAVGAGLLAMSNTVAAERTASLDDNAAAVYAAEKRVTAADAELESLPNTVKVAEWVTKANVTAASVVDIQNGYLANSGDPSLDGIPLGEGEGRDYVAYSEEERYEKAVAARTAALDELERRSLAVFAPADTDNDGQDASDDWAEVAELDAPGLTWVAVEATWLDLTQRIPLLWELHDDTGSVVTWATAAWNPKDSTIHDFALGQLWTAPADDNGDEQ